MSDSGGDLIPSFRLGPEEIPRGQRFEAWHETTRPLYDSAPLDAEASFECRVEAYLCADVVVNRCIFGPHTLARRGHHLRSDETDHLAFRLYVRGQTVQTVGERVVAMAPDAITLVDRRYEMRGHSNAGEVFGALIPRRRIDMRPFEKAPAAVWSTGSPPGRLLAAAVRSLWSELPRVRVADATALASGFVGLLNGLLSPRPSPEQQAALDLATLPAMQRFIERHLDDPELDAARLCRTFHCSRARLYRLFRPLGGVERHIRDRRLQRCLDQLVGYQPARSPTRRAAGPIRAVAATWGFHNPSHFHRLFKARFQVAPSDALALGQAAHPAPDASPPDGHGAPLAQLHRWLRRL